MPTPSASSAAVYLLSKAKPTNRPTAGHQPPEPPATIRAIAQSASSQNITKGKSGVMIIAPAPTKSVAFSSAAATMPAFRPGSRRSAASQSTTEPIAAESGPSNRTPSAELPASQVPARIQNATIGGWSK